MKPTTRRTLLTAALLCGSATLAGAQTTWHVDDDGPGDPFPGVSIPNNPAFSDPLEDGSAAHPYDDIYKAVDAAANGDVVLVHPSNWIGFYSLTSPLDLKGKAITVQSSGGPLVTAIDGDGIPGMSGVLIDSGEGPATVLEGFTLQNCERGFATGANGGALFISGASPTIRGCIFRENAAYTGGGAYTQNGGDPLFEDCRFEQNDAGHQGGGVYVQSGSPRFLRCTFAANSAAYGAGLHVRSVSGDHVVVEESLFLDGDAQVGYAGGLSKFDSGQLSVLRSTFVGNVAPTGGAAHVHGGGTFRDCVFNGNSASTWGGLSANGGGGLGAAGTVRVINSTFASNAGGAAGEVNGAQLELYSSILWGNAPNQLGSGSLARHSLVQGGWGGTGNLDADPLFSDPWGADGVAGTLDDDLTLTAASPCIDAGDTLQLGGASYPVDHLGKPRAADHPLKPDVGVTSLGLTVDMGAFEVQPPSGLRAPQVWKP